MNKQLAFLAISFDGLPASGIVSESLKLIYSLRSQTSRCYIDLGTMIRPNTAYFGIDDPRFSSIPSWISQLSLIKHFENYSKAELVKISEMIRNDSHFSEEIEQWITSTTNIIYNQLLLSFRSLNIDYLIVENGTLPWNVPYTLALQRAIHSYGKERNLARFVIWRDHDTMWHHTKDRYGVNFQGIPKPTQCEFISYVTLTKDAKTKLDEWADGVIYSVLKPYISEQQRRNSNIVRERIGLDCRDILIARCTRVIPEKRIDRDLLLIRCLNYENKTEGNTFHLCVTGSIDENPEEYKKLMHIAKSLDIIKFVHFLNGVEPYEECIRSNKEDISIQDVLEASAISSFLTSYQFEGFGLPPLEASVSMCIPIVSTYKLVKDIYKEFEFIDFPISQDKEGDISILARSIQCVINDTQLRNRLIYHNKKMSKYFSEAHFTEKLKALLDFGGRLPGAIEPTAKAACEPVLVQQLRTINNK